MIPKIIHYCWFGGNEKPELIVRCMESWKKYCPEWEIREWNESNFDVTAVPYMAEAYQCKKWAFVSDIARLMVVHQYGGIYLDTDVELVGSIDAWTDCDAFYFFESTRNIASGLGFGAAPGHPTVKAMLDYYQDKHFYADGKMNLLPCPASNTEALKAICPDFRRNGESQLMDGVQVWSFEAYAARAVHHGAATWVDGPKSTRVYKDRKWKRVLRRSEIFDFIEKYLGKRCVNVYTFLVYDLAETGPGYYVRRAVEKIRRKQT